MLVFELCSAFFLFCISAMILCGLDLYSKSFLDLHGSAFQMTFHCRCEYIDIVLLITKSYKVVYH